MKKRVIFVLLVLILLSWIAWGNAALEQNTYRIESSRLPDSFDGFRIAHVSDLHNAQFGKENETLLRLLKEAKPDIIAITGDLIDSRKTEIRVALKFVKEAMKIAPCYFVSGNHEARIDSYEELKAGLIGHGVTMLENEKIELERNGEKILLLGVDDPSFQTDYLFGKSTEVMKEHLQALVGEGDLFTVLLSHRPELFACYAEYPIDLVLSGHAHGGQFRLPFVGGVAAPNQGFFPKYDAGRFEQNGTTMIVSRGLGNSIIPFRFHNRPEVLLIELTNTVNPET